jgi:hypothetical protein
MADRARLIDRQIFRLNAGLDADTLQDEQLHFHLRETVHAIHFCQRIKAAPEQKFFPLGVNLLCRHSVRARPAHRLAALRPFAPEQIHLISGEIHNSGL